MGSHQVTIASYIFVPFHTDINTTATNTAKSVYRGVYRHYILSCWNRCSFFDVVYRDTKDKKGEKKVSMFTIPEAKAVKLLMASHHWACLSSIMLMYVFRKKQ